ncbi:MAG: undecaprenyldiphospho-muramoylpentapeptide beta-N-acetylglucosaminyltransferase [Alphaproteobacteria bacterium]|nr:undecaprenyldiphospho-muramoylpentapeptide beta-N-acetylglucosaminyltransferase [Alphaproteobacteria bacterium]
MKNILLSAGGTGGHLFPALALAEELRFQGHAVFLATDARAVKFLPKENTIPVFVVPSATPTGGVIKILKSIPVLLWGTVRALALCMKLKPHAIVGFGGYPSFPPMLAGQFLHIPTILHEQNAILGKANMVLAHMARKVALSLPAKIENAKYVVTGNPVRAEIAALADGHYEVPEGNEKINILVVGGSQGSQALSNIVPAAIESLPKDLREKLFVVHQAREADMDHVMKTYTKAHVEANVQPFFRNFAPLLAKSHLVVTRGGASSVAEINIVGRPAIYIPNPHHKDQQQKKNAQAIVDAGGALVFDEKTLTPEKLSEAIKSLISAFEKLVVMAAATKTCAKGRAAATLAQLVLTVAK